MMPVARNVVVLLLASVASLPAAVRADDAEALQWIQRMNEALATRNYDGVFFHVREGRVETLRILHGVQNGTVRERLISLDGSGREFVRKGEELICYMPDQRLVVVEPRRDGGSLLGALPNMAAATSENYLFAQPGRARIMGRDARVVEIRPRDEFRFGYRLWIDEATAMPLKSQLCDGDGKVLEQVVFARLSLPASIAEEAFRLPAQADTFRWLRPDATPAQVSAGVGEDGRRLWNVMRLPPGFRLTTRGTQMLPGSSQPATHLVFSDGLATVSVFVESSAPEGRAPAASGQVGLSSAYSLARSGVQITAVGEVPLTTVRYFATQVRQEAEVDPGAEGRRPGELRPATTPLPQGIPALAPRTPPRR